MFKITAFYVVEVIAQNQVLFVKAGLLRNLSQPEKFPCKNLQTFLKSPGGDDLPQRLLGKRVDQSGAGLPLSLKLPCRASGQMKRASVIDCPQCGQSCTSVCVDTRPAKYDGENIIMRRRKCNLCGKMFRTYEMTAKQLHIDHENEVKVNYHVKRRSGET